MNQLNYVLCNDVLDGLRDSEATVVVMTHSGKPEFVRASRNGLYRNGSRTYLCVGLVGNHAESETALIQFPEEADSGANRAWVPLSDLVTVPEKVSA